MRFGNSTAPFVCQGRLHFIGVIKVRCQLVCDSDGGVPQDLKKLGLFEDDMAKRTILSNIAFGNAPWRSARNQYLVYAIEDNDKRGLCATPSLREEVLVLGGAQISLCPF